MNAVFISSGTFSFRDTSGFGFCVAPLPLTVLPFFCFRVCGFGGFWGGWGGGGGGCFGILSPVLNFWNSIFFWFSLDLEKPRICLSLLMNLFFLRGKKRHATVV